MFREQVALTLKAWPGFEVVGVVDADAIVASLLQLKPDVAVLDPTSLDTETQDEVFALARGETRLLFLSSEADDKSYVAIERGAIGCLTKAIAPQELCNAVAAAARGLPSRVIFARSTRPWESRTARRLSSQGCAIT